MSERALHLVQRLERGSAIRPTKQDNRRHQTSRPVRNLLPLYTTTESNSVAHSGEYVGDFGYLREYGTDIDISNAMLHMTRYGKP